MKATTLGNFVQQILDSECSGQKDDGQNPEETQPEVRGLREHLFFNEEWLVLARNIELVETIRKCINSQS